MKILPYAALLAATLSAPGWAQSPEPASPMVPTPRMGEAPPPATAIRAAPRAQASPILSDAELDTQRGGESLVITDQTLIAITSGNVLNGDYSAGAVSLSDFALSNFNGVGNLLINTGAQVSAQSAMNLTINLGD